MFLYEGWHTSRSGAKSRHENPGRGRRDEDRRLSPAGFVVDLACDGLHLVLTESYDLAKLSVRQKVKPSKNNAKLPRPWGSIAFPSKKGWALPILFCCLNRQKIGVYFLTTPDFIGFTSEGFRRFECLLRFLVLLCLADVAKNPAKTVSFLVDLAYIDFTDDPAGVRMFLRKFSGLPANVVVAIAYSMSKSFTIYGQRTGALVSASSLALPRWNSSGCLSRSP
jgi:hypothetical protein